MSTPIQTYTSTNLSGKLSSLNEKVEQATQNTDELGKAKRASELLPAFIAVPPNLLNKSGDLTSKPELAVPSIEKSSLSAIGSALDDIRSGRQVANPKSDAQANGSQTSSSSASNINEALAAESADLIEAFAAILNDPLWEKVLNENAQTSIEKILDDASHPDHAALVALLTRFSTVVQQLSNASTVTRSNAAQNTATQNTATSTASENAETSETNEAGKYFSSLRDLLRLIIKIKAALRTADIELRNLQSKAQLALAHEAKEIMYEAASSVLAMSVAGAAISFGGAAVSACMTAASAAQKIKVDSAKQAVSRNELQLKGIENNVSKNSLQIKDNNTALSDNQRQLKAVETKLNSTTENLTVEQRTNLTAQKATLQETNQQLQAKQIELKQQQNALHEQRVTESAKLTEENKTSYEKIHKYEQVVHKLDALAPISSALGSSLSGILHGISESNRMQAEALNRYMNAVVESLGTSANNADENRKSDNDELHQLMNIVAEVAKYDADITRQIAGNIAR